MNPCISFSPGAPKEGNTTTSYSNIDDLCYVLTKEGREKKYHREKRKCVLFYFQMLV